MGLIMYLRIFGYKLWLIGFVVLLVVLLAGLITGDVVGRWLILDYMAAEFDNYII